MYYFKQVKDGVILSVERKSTNVTSPNFIKATKAEYDAFIDALPIIEPEPSRNLASEIDVLKQRVFKLEKKQPAGA